MNLFIYLQEASNILSKIILFFVFTCSILEANNLNNVSLQLQWKHQFEFAGFYMAKEKGFYEDVGIHTTIKELEQGNNTIDEVNNGTTTFGLTYPSVVLEKSIGKDLVLLSAILQTSPHILVSLKSSNINSIKDFKNKSIMINENASNTASFISMLQANNLSLKNMNRKDESFDINDLINKKVDLITAFSSNELFELNKKGIDYTVWDPKDYGFDFYDVILFTTKNTLNNDSDMVDAFTQASLKGWEYAFNHIDETITLILNKYNTQNKTREALLYEANTLKKLAYYKTNKLGTIDINKIQRIYDIYALMGLVKHPIDLNEFVHTPSINKTHFTLSEKEYLHKKESITMCIDPNWMPFESFDKNNKHKGISADYFDIFNKTLNTTIEIIPTSTWTESLEFAQQRKCDMLSLVMQTPIRKQYLNFTSSYINMPLVIATKNDVPFVNSLESLDEKKIGTPKGYAFSEILKIKYQDIELIEVENINDGLERVRNGELFGYIGALVSINYSLQHEYLSDLKIAGKFKEKFELGIGIRDDDKILLNIMEKVIQNITQQQHQDILNKWITVNYEKTLDYTLIWYLLVLILIIIMLSVYRQYILKKSNQLLKERIEIALEENRKKEQVLQEQNKLASMGQMIGAIAHQWRQPLNEISTSIQNLKFDYKAGNLNDEVFVKNFIDTNKKTIHFMSRTIDDFRNFFKVNKDKKEFPVYETTKSVLNMQSAQLSENNIQINIIGNEFLYTGFQSEYQQVILNIINNAKDALIEHKIQNPQISVIVKDKTVTIKDNAGGIPSEVLPRIFEPYFSTKEQGQGIGIGLYMSKVIIEKNMGASLKAINDSQGAMFIIKF